MRTVLSFCVIISAAVACPTIVKKDCSFDLPKICPPEWNIKQFESQFATLAFQEKWYLQMVTPTYIDGQDPLKTGLFCNTYPCTQNELIFEDTTPCDDTDFNTEYQVTDSSFNLYTQSREIQKALLSPAYGKNSKYALFNVGSEKYYKTPIIEKYPFIDDNLIRHELKGICEREYTVAAIGSDDCWKEYVVFVVINRYENIFCDNDYLVWLMTRKVQPDWSTYQKAFEDIKRSGLNPYHMVSVDQSLGSLTLPSIAPILPCDVDGLTSPITPGDINGVVQQTSTSTTSATKSIVSGSGSSSTTQTTTQTVQTSTVVIDISPDFTSPYDIGPCDLYNTYEGVQILKGMDKKDIGRALSGTYYMCQATPCSFFDSPNSRVGILNTAAPAISMQLIFDDISKDTWDYNTPCMVMDRGYNMLTGDLQQTRSYISSLYPEDHPYGSSVFSMFSEGYYDQTIDEINSLTLDGMICKQPSDIYSNQIILSIIGYKDDDYVMFCVANQYKNPFLPKKSVPLIYCYTRERIPSQSTLNSITQELLRCGLNPNHMIKIDQTRSIETPFTFDKSYYESKVTTNSMTRSIVSTSGLPPICPQGWDVKTFEDQCATIAFQGIWNLQMATPTFIRGNNPLKTGLFCNTYPCTQNQFIFEDTTPCDDTDFNTEYQVTDSSFNLYTQSREIQKALLSPAYGKNSKYALFNVGSEKYYKTPIIEKYPFIDDNLIRHELKGICEREYTVAAIGSDDCWKEYVVFVVINRYENIFCDNDYLVWLMTRKVQPDWSTYQKAFEDIKRSGLNPYHMVSVDQSLGSLTLPSIAPILPCDVDGLTSPITPGDINGVVQQTSTSTTSSTKSIVSGSGSSSTTQTTTQTVQTSTVVIDIRPDYSSLYDFGQCDLYNGIQIIKNLKNDEIRRALSGKYYMCQATPCSFFDSPNSRVGILNTAAPAISMQLIFDGISKDTWDYNTPCMMMDRGYNMLTGDLQETRSYISSLYPEDHPFGCSVFSMFSEGYYDQTIDEINSLTLDGMICKQPSDIYSNQIILSIIGYKDDDYVIFSVANQYKNPFFSSEQPYQVYCYTRERIPCQETLRCMTQDLLHCGYNPNNLIRIDQTLDITDDYVFDSTYYESETSCWSSSSSSYSSSSSRSSTTVQSSSSSSISISCD